MRSGEALTHLIDDILDLAKVESGHLEIEYRETQLMPNGSTSSFIFEAKRVEMDLQSVEPKVNKEAIPLKALNNLRVLLVEDSPENQFLVKRLLVKNGAIVETASDGQEGFIRAMLGSHDVVLMDIQMPLMDGFQVKLSLDERSYRTPVIALTAHAMKEERVKTAQAGFAGHLTKPVGHKELVEMVARMGEIARQAPL